MGRAERDPSWLMYRSADDPKLHRNQRDNLAPRPRAARPTPAEDVAKAVDWSAMQAGFVQALADHLQKQLAKALGVPLLSLDQLPGLGFHAQDRRGPCWTSPEVDGQGNIVGIQRRYEDGHKAMVKGSRRGLTVPVEWDNYSEAIYIVEGASDVLALVGMGLSAVGRPFNSGGLEDLAVLLADLSWWDRLNGCRVDRLEANAEVNAGTNATSHLVSPLDRPIIVMGENDRKDSGEWPGYFACTLSENLGKLLGRPILARFPAEGSKDVRAWFVQQQPRLPGPQARTDLAGKFQESLRKAGGDEQQEAKDTSGLNTLSCNGTDDEAVSWLVQGYMPKGKLSLLAGQGGAGKSLITLDLAACVSRGRACLGLNYDPPEARDVLLANCEDDLKDTIRPRLRAAGANLDRVHLIKGTIGAEGKQVAFNLCHLPEIEAHLQRHPEIGLVIVDPAGAFTGGSGFDDHRDSEVRKVLGPLSDLAGRHGVAILLVMHFSKGTTAKAVNKVMGSAGYTNASRAAFSVQTSQDNPGQRVLGVLKFNCGPDPSGRAFRIRPLDQAEQEQATAALAEVMSDGKRRQLAEQMCRVQWLGDTDESPDAINAAESLQVVPLKSGVAEASRWLAEFLKDGPRASAECVEQGNEALDLDRGAKWWRAEVLNKSLQGRSCKAGYQGTWLFALPGQTLPS